MTRVSDAPRRRHRWPAPLLAVAGVVSASGCGSDDEVGTLRIEDVWARPTAPGASSGALYFTIASPDDDVLEAVSVDPVVAAAVSLHATITIPADEDAGTAAMVGMESMSSVPVVADELVVFQPSGTHAMLEGLTRPLVDGQRFDATLRFRDAGELDVEVLVGDQAP
ncbi:MAG: copper chaperone PCu(A)C [Desertimonas sp.]